MADDHDMSIINQVLDMPERRLLGALDDWLSDAEGGGLRSAAAKERFGYIILTSGAEVGPISWLVGYGSFGVHLSDNPEPDECWTHTVLYKHIAGVRYV